MMTQKTAELLLILLGLAGVLIMRGLRSHIMRKAPATTPAAELLDFELLLLSSMMTVALVILPVIDFFWPALDFADLPFSATLACIGVGFALLSIALFGRTLADYMRYRKNAEPAGISAGIYRYVRHPFYTALLLWVCVQFLLLQNWVDTSAAIIAFAIMYMLRIPHDELHWLERFGHRYLYYMEETGALLPRWNSWLHK
jgi:protein-S-isoprenylcysteine O-methyltransferase Ste14